MKKILLSAIFFSALTSMAIPAANAQVSIGVNITVAPPALPVYEQPFCPGDGYIWTPGYWNYGPDGYYWVPGEWVLAPEPGLLWTPGYWGFVGGFYRWHHGYWGVHVGYYGGIVYGFGYTGIGFGGGMWVGNVYRYNTAVTRVNSTVIHNTYVNNTYIVNNVHNTNRYSYNGPGGMTRKPTAEERTFSSERHVPATAQQRHFAVQASKDRNQLASSNNGHPRRLFGENRESESANSGLSQKVDKQARFKNNGDGQMQRVRNHPQKTSREFSKEAKSERKAERRAERKEERRRKQ